MAFTFEALALLRCLEEYIEALWFDQPLQDFSLPVGYSSWTEGLIEVPGCVCEAWDEIEVQNRVGL